MCQCGLLVSCGSDLRKCCGRGDLFVDKSDLDKEFLDVDGLVEQDCSRLREIFEIPSPPSCGARVRSWPPDRISNLVDGLDIVSRSQGIPVIFPGGR
jgi:hypothetical protein